jgi:hypothetical protein
LLDGLAPSVVLEIMWGLGGCPVEERKVRRRREMRFVRGGKKECAKNFFAARFRV